MDALYCNELQTALCFYISKQQLLYELIFTMIYADMTHMLLKQYEICTWVDFPKQCFLPVGTTVLNVIAYVYQGGLLKCLNLNTAPGQVAKNH